MNKKISTFMKLLSFSMGAFLMEFFQATYTSYQFFFYETEIKLSPSLVSLGLALISAWKMVSDPLFGYLFDKHSKGNAKRFRNIWILISFLPWVGSVVLFFNVPDFNPETQSWLIFIWMVGSSLIYGTFFTIFGVSFFSALPTKFTDSTERSRLQGFTGILSYLGMLLGALLPTLLIVYNSKESFGRMSWIVAGLGLIPFVILAPGLLKELRAQPNSQIHKTAYTQQEPKHEKFFRSMIMGLKQRNYRLILLLSFTNQVMMACVGGSLHYILKYIVHTEAKSATILYLGYFGGAFIGSYVWSKIAEKVQNTKKMYIIQSLSLLVAQIPLFFIRYYNLYVASALLIPYSFCFAGFWATLRVPISSEVFDEIAAHFKQRKDTTYMGFRSIFFQLGWVFQSLAFGLIHTLTDFDESITYQPISAERGIIFGFVGVPIIIQSLTLVVFYLRYTLTPERVKYVKNQLRELNLK